MINWNSVLVEQQRRQDEVSRAMEYHRLQHIRRQPTEETRKRKGHIMAPVLIRAGNWLVSVGCRLQAPYASLALAARNGIQQDHIMAPHKAPCAS